MVERQGAALAVGRLAGGECIQVNDALAAGPSLHPFGGLIVITPFPPWRSMQSPE